MSFLYAFFYLYAAIAKSIQLFFWKINGILNKKYLYIKPYKKFKFKVCFKGFVVRLVYISQPLRFFKRSFEYKVFRFIEQSIKSGDVVVDVGANVGVLTLFMSQIVGEKGKVFAIEASANNAQILKENLLLNNIKNVKLINHAVSDIKKQVYMASPSKEYNDALLVMEEEESSSSESIIALSFDEIADTWNIENPKLIKIDIEGAEIFFFKGAQEFFKVNKPVLIFETLEQYTKRFNYSAVEVLWMIYNLGYSVEQMDSETWVALPKS